MVDAACGQGDCAAYGATCVDDELGLRCVSVFCPALGAALVCLPGETNGLIGNCDNGALTTGDCGGFGAICSTMTGVGAKCVSAFCAATPDEPIVAKDVCLPDGDRYTCSAAGDIDKTPCPPSYLCSMALPGGAHCVSTECVASAAETPVEKDVCLADGARYHCDANGTLTPNPCAAGDLCDGGACVTQGGSDAGTPPSNVDAGSTPVDASDPGARPDASNPRPRRSGEDAGSDSPRQNVVHATSGGCATSPSRTGTWLLFVLVITAIVAGTHRRRTRAGTHDSP